MQAQSDGGSSQGVLAPVCPSDTQGETREKVKSRKHSKEELSEEDSVREAAAVLQPQSVGLLLPSCDEDTSAGASAVLFFSLSAVKRSVR